MTTDRELLELAAKAFGIVGEWVEDHGSGDYYYQGNANGILYELPQGGWVVWNPLTDDGDALRLAVALEIDISFCVNVDAIYWRRDGDGEQRYVYQERGISEAATRRAIVRAAASIGMASK